jgi:hypothetical protein
MKEELEKGGGKFERNCNKKECLLQNLELDVWMYSVSAQELKKSSSSARELS